MNAHLPETFVDRVVREVHAFISLWRKRRLVAALVLIVGAVISYPQIEKLFRPNPISVRVANDPDRTFFVKTLVRNPEDRSETYLYFLKADGDVWFEVNSAPYQYTRFMFRMKKIDRDQIVLYDDTRDVTLTLDFAGQQIHYRGPGTQESRVLYEIVAAASSG